MNVALPAVSVCSGVGGLDLGLQLALPGGLRTVLYVERECFAAANLVKAMEEGALDAAPVWSDLTTLTGTECGAYLRAVGQIGILYGGIPCQPWSTAGRRLGTDDDRDLWPPTLAAVKEFAPLWVFLENVPGFAVPDGLGRVCEDLEGLGYRVAAGLFSAEEVGAPHGRLRLFVLAHKHGSGLDRFYDGIAVAEHERLGAAAGNSAELAHARCKCDKRRYVERCVGLFCHTLEGEAQKRQWARDSTCCQCAELVHPGLCAGGTEQGDQCEQGDGAWEPGEPVAEPSGVGRRGGDTGPTVGGGRGLQPQGETEGPCRPLFPPGPLDREGWRRVLALWPWLAPATQRPVRRMADGASVRVDQLRALGNSVVPLTAALAFVSLYADLAGEDDGAVVEAD